MAIIGIDLGTTNSLAAVWRNGKSELIPNGLGEYLTPSVVSVDEDGSILVGAAARDRLITHPECTAAGFKRAMGTSRRYELGSRTFTPEDLSAFVLRRLREDAEAYLGEAVNEAVVSVPAYFAEAQRSATKRAGALAGLTVERLVNEPSAAAVAGRIGEGEEDKVCLVFDFGGGTLDVSLVERFENVVSVTAVSGDNCLGGRDFDELIARGFCQDCGLDFDTLSLPRQETLRRQAETCKIALTAREPVIMAVSDDEISASLALTHEWVIRKSSLLFQRMLAPVRKVFMDAGVGVDELDELVMVGGSSHMPSVRRYIAKALNLEPAAAAQAFVSGQNDAAMTYEPYLSTVRAAPDKGKIIATTLDYPIVMDTFGCTPKFLTDNPKAAQALANSYFEALDMIAKDQAKAYEIMGADVKQTGEQFGNSAKYLRWQDKAANQKFFAGDFLTFNKDAAELLLEVGIIKAAPKVEDIYDASFIK